MNKESYINWEEWDSMTPDEKETFARSVAMRAQGNDIADKLSAELERQGEKYI